VTKRDGYSAGNGSAGIRDREPEPLPVWVPKPEALVRRSNASERGRSHNGDEPSLWRQDLLANGL